MFFFFTLKVVDYSGGGGGYLKFVSLELLPRNESNMTFTSEKLYETRAFVTFSGTFTSESKLVC